MRIINKILICTIFISTITLLSSSKVSACSYEAIISGNTLSFKITTDADNLAMVQYLPINGSTQKIVRLDSPDIGTEWNYYSDNSSPNCGIFNGNGALACNQTNSNGAYWSIEIPINTYHPLPSGVYKIEFDSPPTYEKIGIEYGLIPGSSGENWTFCNRTGDIEFPTPSTSPSPIPTPTPTPTITPTPTSTPTPSPTPLPVNKIIFAPGITASWNVDALINCKTNPIGDWILAPYAESVYSPLLKTFKKNGWNLFEFYYDWRKKPQDTADKLEAFIDANTKLNEKVNFIGHSMGGLIGKSYLDNTSGIKINSFLSVGTPYKGSALAYPPWEGAETWGNNLLEKIATTLYLKHCGGLFSNNLEMIHGDIPALQSLLPVNPYLQNKKDLVTRLPLSDDNKNNWFTNTLSNFSGVRSGNIAGTGIETLKIIQTKVPNKKDQKNNLWVDGSPAGKITDFEGDGTVLVNSALMDTADEKIIVNQSHRGLVSSVEGIETIMNFFGTSGGYTKLNLNTEVEQPNSALILIGHPATFSIVDKNGNVKNDKQGMIAIMNPKSGNYKLSFISRTSETTFVIAQFLPNGNLKYKEYKFKGFGPKFKNINFNIENPQEDILK